jgi:hypothetical protein
MERRPRVLLIHEEVARRQAWRAALSNCDVCEAASLTELRDLGVREIEVVVCHFDEHMADGVRAVCPGARFIHFDDSLPTAVLEAVWQGHEVCWVARASELALKVASLSRPMRAAPRVTVDGFEVVWAGSTRSFCVVDVSNDGFSFSVATGDDLERLLPGTILDEVIVSHDGSSVIDGVRAEVRRIDVCEQDYRVGCELRMNARAPHKAKSKVITDRAQCAGLLMNALRNGALAVESGRGDGEVHCVDGSVDLAREEFSIPQLSRMYRDYDVLDCCFELQGNAYRFRAVVCDETGLRLKFPACLEETRQRSWARFRPTSGQITVSVRSTLLPEPLVRKLFDLSISGLSFVVDANDVLPIGLRLQNIVIVVAGQMLCCSGQVRSLTRSSSGVRCGVELDPLDERNHRLLSEAIVRDRHPTLQNGGELGFNELLRFFRETGFLPAEKEALLAPVIGEVRRTYESLYSRSSPVARSAMIRENGNVVGYVAGLRAYRSTWMYHHLAAVKGKQAGTLLSEVASEYMEQETSLEHFRIWFYARANVPGRLFGAFARKIADPHLSDLRRYGHFLLDVDRRFGPGGIAVYEADDSDLVTVERYFVARDRPLLVRAEELTRGGLRLDNVGRHFLTEGVIRQRRVLMARRDGRAVGFALAEVSSCGLNLYDALSSVRIFVLPDGEANQQQVRCALLDGVLPLYAQTGRRQARVLINPSEAADYRALGITVDDSESLCWTCHRTQLNAFSEHLRQVFSLVLRGARGGATLTAAA